APKCPIVISELQNEANGTFRRAPWRMKKGTPKRALGMSMKANDRLPLAELEATAGAALAVLLALLHSAVAGQEAGAAEGDLEAVVVLGQRAAQAHDYGAGLAGRSAAVGVHHHVHLPRDVGDFQRAEDRLAIA